MARYQLTNKAVEDLSNIWNFTYRVWSEAQADTYYGMLIGTCQEISENPTIGKNYAEISPEILGFRVGRHILFYRVIGPGEIDIVRMLHDSMDLKRRLEDQ